MELSKLINNSNKKKIDVVILSETWVTPSSLTRINVPGYDFIGKQRTNKKGGGVGILINKNLKYKVRLDLEITDSILENCSIELKTSVKNIIIGSMYRPPNTNQREFVEDLKSYIEKIDSKFELIIGMDHNMDLLKSEQNSATQDFMNSLIDHDLFPSITKPTRITKSSATLIDNILISRALYPKCLSGILINDMSDHLPCISVIKNAKSLKDETIVIMSRDMKGDNLKELRKSLKIKDWSNILPSMTDVDNQFETFHELLMFELDKYCPEKRISVSPKRTLREPWLTKGLINSFRKQRALYHQFLKDRTEIKEQKYKVYRNTLQRITRKEKQRYYNNQCITFKSNSKKLWQLISRISNKHNNKSCLIDSLKIENVESEDPTTICNEFGKYFSTVGSSYASKIPESKNTIAKYLENINHNPKSLFLVPCTETELAKLIDKLPNKKSSGYDRVSNALLKDLKDELVKPLTLIFNNSLQSGVFPSIMKHTEVVPLYKTGLTNLTANY